MKNIRVLFKFHDLISLRESDFDSITIKKDCYLKNIETLQKIGFKFIHPEKNLSKVLSTMKKPNLGFEFLFFGSYIFSLEQFNNLKVKPKQNVNILNWLVTDFDKKNEAEDFISELKKYPECIQYAYIQKGVKSPTNTFDTEIYAQSSMPEGGHLNAIGYDAALEKFHSQYGNDIFFGKKTKIAIVEKSGKYRFPDIDGEHYYEYETPQTDYIGQDSTDNINHGLNTLGVIISKNDKQGSTGIAPNAEIYLSTQINNNIFSYQQSIFKAILSLICYETWSAAILLIELETAGDGIDGLPLDFYPEVFDLIEQANEFGITTILPAGNGRKNLNFQFDNESNRKSSAIMVGATMFSVEPNQNMPTTWEIRNSNFGQKVDVYICGENILTTGYKHDLATDNKNYVYNYYAQTSGASAIIAGMVAAIQDVAIRKYGLPLLPQQVRELLKNNHPIDTSLTGFSSTYNRLWDYLTGGINRKYQFPNLETIISSILAS